MSEKNTQPPGSYDTSL